MYKDDTQYFGEDISVEVLPGNSVKQEFSIAPLTCQQFGRAVLREPAISQLKKLNDEGFQYFYGGRQIGKSTLFKYTLLEREPTPDTRFHRSKLFHRMYALNMGFRHLSKDGSGYKVVRP